MAELIKCKVCGADIANTAKSCPHCGAPNGETKFCQHCGETIDADCVVCPKCGKQVMELRQQRQTPVVINNTNTNTAHASVRVGMGRMKNKWVAFFLCLFLGILGVHKFYEGKVVLGIVYLFTGGLFGIGWIIDTIVLLFKPNPYFV